MSDRTTIQKSSASQGVSSYLPNADSYSAPIPFSNSTNISLAPYQFS